jgi:hypothetical protein
MANADGGDTVLFLDGTYIATGGGYRDAGIEPAPGRKTSAAKPIVLRSYNKHGAIIVKGDGGAVIGTGMKNGNNHVHIEDFDIRGGACLVNTVGSRITGCKFSVGGVKSTRTEFGSMLFLQSCVGALVQGNEFSNNVPVLANLNDAAIMIYTDRGTVIEHNTFRDLGPAAGENKVGVFLKDAPGYDGNPTVVRFNFFEDACIYGPLQNPTERTDRRVHIYQNVLTGPRAYFVYRGFCDVWLYYNNTHFNSRRGVLAWGDFSGVEYFNNIVHASDSNLRSWNDAGLLGKWSYWNCNLYAKATVWSMKNTPGYTSLSLWKAAPGKPDSNSAATPLRFVKPGGSSPEDYRVVGGAPPGGRGGPYPEVLGAFVTGDERIGALTQGIHTRPRESDRIMPRK